MHRYSPTTANHICMVDMNHATDFICSFRQYAVELCVCHQLPLEFTTDITDYKKHVKLQMLDTDIV